MALYEQSTTRRAFFKVVGAVSSFLVFVKCKTFGPDQGADLLAVEPLSPEAAPFMAASEALTGFKNLDTGLANQYYADLKAEFGEDKVKDLTDAYQMIASSGGDVEAQIAEKIMGDASLAKVAGASIMIWYYGGFNKIQPPQPVAVKAYQKGLVWQSFKGKPMGVPDEMEGTWGASPALD
jgi:hypothetical protein